MTASGRKPLRTAFSMVPNGAIPAAWWPTGEGKQFELNRTMKSLEPVKEHIQILGGLDDISAVGGPDGGGEHARANGTFLTGVRIIKGRTRIFHAGVSADQIMARQIGLLTPFRSLELYMRCRAQHRFLRYRLRLRLPAQPCMDVAHHAADTGSESAVFVRAAFSAPQLKLSGPKISQFVRNKNAPFLISFKVSGRAYRTQCVDARQGQAG